MHEISLPLRPGVYELLAAVFSSSWLAVHYFDHRPFRSLGLMLYPRWILSWMVGFVIGVSWLLTTAVFLLKLKGSGLHLNASRLAALPESLWITTFAGVLFEEVFFRGYEGDGGDPGFVAHFHSFWFRT